MEYFFVIVLGIVIGSFLNVCIYRIPRRESIKYPASHCDSCGVKLGAGDLIPVVSYFIHRGRCRSCGEKIDCLYPVIEVLNAALYSIIYVNMGLNIINIKYYILASILIVIGVIDYQTKYIFSNTVIVSELTGTVFIIREFIFQGIDSVQYIIGGLLGFLIIKIMAILTKGFGDGDYEIAVICGMFLGIKGVIFTILLAIFMGGIVSIFILFFDIKKKKETIPFVPFMSAAAFLMIVYGNEIINFYFRLI